MNSLHNTCVSQLIFQRIPDIYVTNNILLPQDLCRPFLVQCLQAALIRYMEEDKYHCHVYGTERYLLFHTTNS